MQMKWITTGACALALAACGDEPQDEVVAEAPAEISASLAPFGDGYPAAGDPCRRLGESEATGNYLDDSAMLVGCPTQALAEALGGEQVGEVEGAWLVSVPLGDANMGMGENGPVESEDALVPGTEYNATTFIDCGFEGAAPTQSCEAGVVRNWGEAGTHLVEVSKPDGFKRALFFEGTTPTGADSAQADGSAGWSFETSREGDRVTITFGPETYVIVDALIEGG